jgi:predicted RNase H-like nuclease
MLGRGGPKFTVRDSFAEVWEWAGEGASLFVDIPIGLPAEGSRQADREARQALPAHLKSTIFNTPVRRAVYAGSKEEARQINRQLSGKSLSEQSLGIMKKIKDVDSFLQAHPDSVPSVFESHPETCFGRLTARFPAHGKKDLLGGMERFRITREFIPNLEPFMVSVREGHARSKVASDDILDGCILAVTARECGGNPRFLPAGLDAPPRDETGLPMAIWYHEI